jgi:hypothetical protein
MSAIEDTEHSQYKEYESNQMMYLNPRRNAFVGASERGRRRQSYLDNMMGRLGRKHFDWEEKIDLLKCTNTFSGEDSRCIATKR